MAKSKAQRQRERELKRLGRQAIKERAGIDKRTIAIDKAYELYLQTSQKKVAEWNRKHWKYNKSSAPISSVEEFRYALDAQVDSKGRIKNISKKSIMQAINKLVVAEHTHLGKNRSLKITNLSFEKLKELKNKGAIDAKTYNRFLDRLKNAAGERKQLEIRLWTEELYASIKGYFAETEESGSYIATILYGSN